MVKFRQAIYKKNTEDHTADPDVSDGENYSRGKNRKNELTRTISGISGQGVRI